MRNLTLEEQQFRACFLAWCRHYNAPEPEHFLTLADVEHPDRALFYAFRVWENWCEQNLSRATLGIKRHHPFGDKNTTAVCGWRGKRTMHAIQVIVHTHTDWGRVIEVDFDRFNPNQGLAPAVAHFFAEFIGHRLPKWLWGRKKLYHSPFAVARAFARDGIPVKILSDG